MGERSKVYMTDLRCRPGVSLLNKLEKLMRTAGIGEINFERKLVAIKMHFGEPGNLAFLRPNYAKVVADVVKSLGGVPFLTDCNTLYPGRRKNALEHLDAAYENGFSPLSTGCQVIIGDGLRGNDDVEVPVEGAEYIQTAKIGKAIMEADVIISLSPLQRGMSRPALAAPSRTWGWAAVPAGARWSSTPRASRWWRPRRCVGCRRCATQCAHGAITFGEDRKASIDWDKCVGCGRCIAVCNTDAIRPGNDAAMEELGCRMAEYAKAVVDGRPQFHISLVIDVSPYCDCHGENDLPIVPDVGMFASFDPVALDQACVDAVYNSPDSGKAALIERMESRNGIHTVEAAQALGLGRREYELVALD
mgnify:CR=1 FL=1